MKNKSVYPYIRLTDNYVAYFARPGTFGKTQDITKYFDFAKEMRKRGLLNDGK